MKEGMRVVLADDHATARLGVRLALEEGGFHVVAEAVDARGAVEAAMLSIGPTCVCSTYTCRVRASRRRPSCPRRCRTCRS